MTINDQNFLKIEEIIIGNTKAIIFQNNNTEDYQTGVIIEAEKNINFNYISSELINFYFVKLMNINTNTLSNKICCLVSQSIKFTNEAEYNKFFVSKSEITKKTKNLIFLKTHFFNNQCDIIAFSNSIWKIT
ncbi:MAG: hypothetical protein CMM49_08315 [Rhodospirillaceae bacterium]|nr:hypothetical protein [Rhodospirillaceae bacterium]|tara:strand:+ start:13235 stop:13630 length:396 start_codon:yes stop_codon:yes gene_type:complete